MIDCGSTSSEVKHEYEKFVIGMNPPRVSVDNETNEKATLIKVDSVNKHGSLLQVVQVLNDLNLTIKRAYISTDGDWIMDVFHVVDEEGNKLYDSEVVERIQQSLNSLQSLSPTTFSSPSSSNQPAEIQPPSTLTTIELIGSDRPGLLSEIFAVLDDLQCAVVAAQAWTHNSRMAAVIRVADRAAGGPVEDARRLAEIQNLLPRLLSGGEEEQSGTTKISVEAAATDRADRRLHQMMYEDGDFDGKDWSLEKEEEDGRIKTVVVVEDCAERGYSLVYARSKDRPKLMFDTVWTLSDLGYVVFHATVVSEEPEAYQEYYFRHIDGRPVNSEEEKQKLIQCLEAAISRRSTKGLRLELRSEDRISLLPDLTRILREHGLRLARAEVSTRESQVLCVFYVTDASGGPVESHTVESLKKEMGTETALSAKDEERFSASTATSSKGCGKASFRNLCKLFRSVKFFFSLCLIRSCS